MSMTTVNLTSPGANGPVSGPNTTTVVNDSAGSYDNGSYERDMTLLASIKDGLSGVERSEGDHYGDILKTIKDAQFGLEQSSGSKFGATMGSIKDAHSDVVKTVKDAQFGLEATSGTRYGNTMQILKDVESTIERASLQGFAQSARDVKENQIALEKAHAVTRDLVRQSEISAEKENCQTRSLVQNSYSDLKTSIFNAEKDLGYSLLSGFKDQLIEDKAAQALAYQLAAAADKTACINAALAERDRQTHAAANALAFKEVQLMQERIAAAAAANACEVKELIRADGEKTRSLLTSNEMDRLREKATKAELQLSSYFSRNIAPTHP